MGSDLVIHGVHGVPGVHGANRVLIAGVLITPEVYLFVTGFMIDINDIS